MNDPLDGDVNPFSVECQMDLALDGDVNPFSVECQMDLAKLHKAKRLKKTVRRIGTTNPQIIECRNRHAAQHSSVGKTTLQNDRVRKTPGQRTDGRRGDAMKLYVIVDDGSGKLSRVELTNRIGGALIGALIGFGMWLAIALLIWGFA